ncbi:MAG TPA: prolipoprotein diacylglyceryl transferase [Candidatus Moranbacteria bacterium]|jgi:phosphatidylglycerol:prolipoprotein diacylglycerol transferase|nr:prolipoprotein diacylglyceryl transferase [Candidatus Moranbacteria bacterium]HOF42233.1 prolipoprotein diacylglyceryl transferase [Candidatus Moranbacteria bacterium]HPX94368.1 prolipoprotein diacylglyceryl transferase [Candidatus Moranbacteria bacterium]HQB59497.1 prolipoprotein diacylglyceryl transferase [Candidatus Moranbacteria bacterium]
MDFLYFYQNIPLYINPVAFTIGPFSVRWYAVSYIVGFLVAYLVLIRRIKKGEYVVNEQGAGDKGQKRNAVHCALVMDFLLVAFFSALVGARLGYVLIYDPAFFISNPLAIISPFDQAGNFVGIFGMSYHGGLAGVILGGIIFCGFKKINFWRWADFVVPAVPLGYFFGRIGNFLNGELYGRVTTSPLGMYFSSDPQNLRYPSQLLEAFLEGLLLFFVVLGVRRYGHRYERRYEPLAGFFRKDGMLLAVYIAGYGIFRIIAEQFRQPDPQIGLISGYFTIGQILSLFMVILGALIIFRNRKQML